MFLGLSRFIIIRTATSSSKPTDDIFSPLVVPPPLKMIASLDHQFPCKDSLILEK